MGSRSINTTAEQAAGAIAEEEYLRYGDQQPSLPQLQKIAEGMQRARLTPKRQLLLAGVHLDTARHPMTPRADVASNLSDATYRLNLVATRDLTESVVQDYRFILQARMQRAYLPRTAKTLLEGMSPTLEDEEALTDQILRIGAIAFMGLANTPENQNQLEAQKVIKGIQFELGMHLLHARTNLREGRMLRYIWPNLPREESPHTYDFSKKEGIDALVSPNSMFAAGAQKLQFKSVGEVNNYADDITTIVGREDLGTRYSGQIMDLALVEANSDSEKEAEKTAEILDEFTDRFEDAFAT